MPASYAIIEKPGNMSFTEAAAVPLGGWNALHFMNLARLKTGDEVLINGAGGSIGCHAIQIARAKGARVTAVDGAHKAAALKALGAAEFIDYRIEDFSARSQQWDVIFDMVPGSPSGRYIRRLKPGGCYLSGNPTLATMLRCAITNRFTNKRASFAFAEESRDALRALKEMIEAGQIGAIVDTVLPLAEAAAAHRRVESEERLGAVVLEVG